MRFELQTGDTINDILIIEKYTTSTMKNILHIKTLIEGNIYVIEKTLKKKIYLCAFGLTFC